MTGPRARAVIVFDLDGTLYRGMAPLRRYAREIARRLPARARGRFALAARAHLSGQRPLPGDDDWDALVGLARSVAMDPGSLLDAFETTRAWMMAGDCPLEVPAGAAALLRRASARALTVVASNSPDASVGPLLERLGLGGLADVVMAMAGKPDGFVPTVERACARGDAYGVPVLSVGDNDRNDIAPALARGWDAAHIHGARPPRAAATFAAPTFEAIAPLVGAWLDERSGGVSPGPLTRSERSM